MRMAFRQARQGQQIESALRVCKYAAALKPKRNNLMLGPRLGWASAMLHFVQPERLISKNPAGPLPQLYSPH